MADTTTVMALPYPEGSDANDVPADMQALAERLDEAPGIESLTSAEISALAAGEKPAGRFVYNSTTSKLQVSNGTTFANIDAAVLLLAGGTMAGAIAMGSNKITGLAAGTTAGDAVRYEQALLLAGGTMAGNINANGNKVTGLAAATANGDAVRYEQVAPVYAIGERTSSVQTITGFGTTATVTTPTETDPSGILASSGVVTVPSAGVWLVTGSISYDGDGIGTLTVRRNSTDLGSANNHYAGAGGGLYGSITVSQIVVCAASDTIELRAQNGSPIDLDIRRVYFTVVKIGL